MLNFTKYIMTKQGRLNFSFKQCTTEGAEDARFNISASLAGLSFDMILSFNSGKWTFDKKNMTRLEAHFPFIIEMEQQFSDIINNEYL